MIIPHIPKSLCAFKNGKQLFSGVRRVIRGGSWWSREDECTSSERDYLYPEESYENPNGKGDLGLRLACPAGL